MPNPTVFFDTLEEAFPARQGEFEGPLSDTSLEVMGEIQKLNHAMNYHYSHMNSSIIKMGDLQKQADTFRDNAAEHKAKLMESENKLRELMEELQAELADDLASHEPTDPNPIVSLRSEDIGRQV